MNWVKEIIDRSVFELWYAFSGLTKFLQNRLCMYLTVQLLVPVQYKLFNVTTCYSKQDAMLHVYILQELMQILVTRNIYICLYKIL